MRRSIYSLGIFVLFTCNLFAQKEDYIWIFGDSMGLDFNYSPPLVIYSEAVCFEAQSNFYDYFTGKVLYTSTRTPVYSSSIGVGHTVRNELNIEIFNGWINSNSTYTMGNLFLKSSGQHDKVCLFTLGPCCQSSFFNPGSLTKTDFYFGQIDSVGVVNQSLFNDSLCEKLVAIRHGNGIDWWVVTKRSIGSAFLSFLFKDDSLLPPIWSFVGPSLTANTAEKIGFFSVSNDGMTLCYVDNSGWIGIFPFDRCTGFVLSPKLLTKSPPLNGYYGCEFSESGEFLYIKQGQVSGSRIFQINLSQNNIISTAIEIFRDTITGFANEWSFGAMKRGPDKKIYITNYHNHIVNSPLPPHLTFLKSLSVINNPDLPGLACDFQPFSFPLPRKTQMGLPNIPNYRLGSVPIYQLDTPVLVHHINLGDPVTIGVADTLPNISYLWLSPQFPGWSSNQMLLTTSLQDSALFLYIRTDTAAVYSCNERIDSIWVFVQDCQITTTACPVPPICAGDTAWLCASGDGSYLWSPPYNLYNAASGGTLAWPETTTVYTVTLTLGNGCTATDSVTVIVHQNSPPTFEDTTIRKGEPFGEFFPTADTTIRYHYLNQYGCDSTVYWEVRIDTLNSVNSYQLSVNSVEVFPNPVRGILYVKHTNQNAAFRLYNKLGQVVIEQQNLPPGTAAVSLRGLAEGVYFWEYALSGTGERVFGKTVKTN